MSDLGAINHATSSNQEDMIAKGQQGTSPRSDNSQDPTEGSAILDAADQNHALQLGWRDSSEDLSDGTNSGENTPRGSASPALSDASDDTIRPSPEQDQEAHNTASTEWTPSLLLEMTDLVRELLKIVRPQSFNPGPLDKLIQAMLDDEDSSHPISLSIIAVSHFDKLVDDLVGFPKEFLVNEPELAAACAGASSLQLKWQQRFKGAYFALDTDRLRNLKEEGALHDIVPKGHGRVLPNIWRVARRTPIPDDDLKPGMWWLNMSCLARDGITKSSREVVTQRHGWLILALLSGTESPGRQPNTYEYNKEGHLGEMHLSLIAPAGRRVRLFRGHTLKSKFAPAAGIRYDGEYIVKSYGHRLKDASRNLFSVTLSLERAPSLMTMDELYLIPSPSQRDDWELYNKVLKDEILIREGADRYYQWKHDEEQVEKDRKNWLVTEKSYVPFIVALRKYRSTGNAQIWN